MSEAIGIHEHSNLKLGARPPSDKPALLFAEHLVPGVVIPQHPVDDRVPPLVWPMDDNNKFGVCVIAAGDHARQAIYTLLVGSYTNMTEAQIFADYKTQNPDFDPNTGAGDNGMDIQTYLNHLVKTGVLLGFAKVDHTNKEEVKAATYLGLAIVTGEDLTVSQQNQAVWDYVPNDAPWGGHSTTTVGYTGSPDQDDGISWGAVFPQTQAFVQHQVTEAWFILTQAHVDHPGFRQGFDLGSFAAAYSNITGRPFPVPVPPPAPPAPPVPPTPTPPPPPVPPTPTPVPPTPTPTPPVPPTPKPPKPPHHHHRHHHPWWRVWEDEDFSTGP